MISGIDRVQVLGSRVSGLGFMLQDLGFLKPRLIRVWGLR
jgi:hypothetical protein